VPTRRHQWTNDRLPVESPTPERRDHPREVPQATPRQDFLGGNGNQDASGGWEPNARNRHVARDLRGDLVVFEGGLIKLPSAVRFGEMNVLGCPTGVNLACLSECIVLAMEGVTRNHSIGNRIDYAEALGVFAAAKRHGFTLHVDLRVAAAPHGEGIALSALAVEASCE